ncbi:MAG TPA: hypothetical protein VLA10_05955 [Ilumatobacter sp.]|nr:hypothetical protein [Ilumatobacter sp.]
MNDNELTPKQLLTSIWADNADGEIEIDEDCSPTKQCRNMRDITFEGFAEAGTDIATAWKTVLAREGKLAPGAETIRDLVLGRDS